MRIGITVWGNIISPVFDAARTMLVADVHTDGIVNKEKYWLHAGSPVLQVETLRRTGVNVLICGAISEVPANMIEGAGIRLIPFIRGNVEEVLNAYLRQQLPTPDFMMPGCGNRRRRRRRGRFRQ